MITFLTTAKPFVGVARIHQFNALRSWRQLDSCVEIILFGSGEGYDEASQDLGVTRQEDVDANPSGLPHVGAMFDHAARHAKNEICAYINCDIILLAGFAETVRSIDFDKYACVAQRWDLDVDRELNFGNPNLCVDLERRAKKEGRLLEAFGVDFFLYKGDVWLDLPVMTIGRAGYDNRLLYDLRRSKTPLVDATETMTIIHQNHDYSHVEGGRKGVFNSAEAEENMRLLAGGRYLFTIGDADWCLSKKGLQRNYCRDDARRCAEVFCVLHEQLAWLSWPLFFFVIESVIELRIRWSCFMRQDRMPLLKFLPWMVKRAVSGHPSPSWASVDLGPSGCA